MQRFNKLLIIITDAALSSYKISSLHYKSTLSDLEISSDAYVLWTLFYVICFENHISFWLTHSAQRYNCLFNDHEQPNIFEHHLNLLAQLLIYYNMQDIFNVHLIHRHLKISHNIIILSLMFKRELLDYWIKPISFEIILANPVHEHIYIVSSDNRLLAYEHREDLVHKNIASIDHTFFRKLFKYLRLNKLAELLTLEILKDTLNLRL